MTTAIKQYREYLAARADAGPSKTLEEHRIDREVVKKLRAAAHQELRDGGQTDHQAGMILRRAEAEEERFAAGRKERASREKVLEQGARAKFLKGGGTEAEFVELWPRIKEAALIDVLRDNADQAKIGINL